MSIPSVIKLSGVSFYQENIKKLVVDDILKLELDANNEYDKNAIKVLKDGKLCGFIPKKYKIGDKEIILNILIKNRFEKLTNKYEIVVKELYKWDGPTGLEIKFVKKL